MAEEVIKIKSKKKAAPASKAVKAAAPDESNREIENEEVSSGSWIEEWL